MRQNIDPSNSANETIHAEPTPVWESLLLQPCSRQGQALVRTSRKYSPPPDCRSIPLRHLWNQQLCMRLPLNSWRRSTRLLSPLLLVCLSGSVSVSADVRPYDIVEQSARACHCARESAASMRTCMEICRMDRYEDHSGATSCPRASSGIKSGIKSLLPPTTPAPRPVHSRKTNRSERARL
jgi:hypothetical protein